MRKRVLLLASTALFVLLASGVALAATISCPNRDANLCVGTPKDDTMTGTKSADDIRGRGGNDSIHSKAGNDKVDGAAGYDEMLGEKGNDTIYGGEGKDRLVGGILGDLPSPGAGDDTLKGEGNRDEMLGAAGDDTLNGGEGEDYMYGYGGVCESSLKEGETDTDTLKGGPGPDFMYGGPGLNDTLVGGPGTDDLNGDYPAWALGCLPQPDVVSLEPYEGDDHIYAVDGEQDFVYCAGGTDTVEADAIDEVDEATCETVNTSTQ
jgi:Ca2+-binding RTX toxin-like protein